MADWRARLADWAGGVAGRDFRWGQTDCGTLGRQALEVMFGGDVMPWLPKWQTRFSAGRVLRRYGEIDAILRRLGAEPRHVSFTNTGDLVTLRDYGERVGRTAVLVCVDAGRCLCAYRDGVDFVRLRDLDLIELPLSYSLWTIDG